MTILDDLRWRDLVAQTTDPDALTAALAAGPVTLYCGFDPTAPSLHVGHLVQVLTLRRFQQAGHRVIALVGGATGLIGDPKETSERSLNTKDVVGEWVGRIRAQIEPFLDFTGDNPALMVNNLDWTASLSTIDFLRDIGKHFPVNRMLARDAVDKRLNSEVGISYTEFSYVLLQSMDYLELYRRHGCSLQIGGSDQWGNITAGAELIRRIEAGKAHALTTQLLTKADGTKFGKTESGTVWLDPALTSPYAFFQFWVNTDDRDVIGYLKCLTFLPQERIEELEKATAERPGAREAQRALAQELTTLVHGAEQTAAVQLASSALFGRGELRDLDAATLAAALGELPSTTVSGPLPTVAELLVATGLEKSNNSARRTISEGGAYVNNVKVTEEAAVPAASDLLHGDWLVLRRGKRNLAAVRVVGS
ncbi:tyrosine--tRNA ligase [Sporichthya polymorpha]|uniref:tyrosine--tRNA ligase n=1 Tax=Sporichthya polymorpha TaxID=35751 RepID=UPI000373588B|nr:tyrosine--tRNA ligase [Sporichthya polymorpha]